MTTSVRRVIVGALCMAASAVSLLAAQTPLRYRTYEMGDDLRTIAQQIGVPSPPGLVVPRPLGVVEELRWRAEYVRRGTAPSGDPVARLVFSFYEDQLFRIVIDYAPDRTEGMTEADLVAAVSKVYGPPAKRSQPPDRVGSHPQLADDVVIAQWTGSTDQVALLTVPGQSAFRMIVSSSRLEALARAAGTLMGPADRHDRPSINPGSPHLDAERSVSAGETTRRANIASFIP
jgi:hypothetical protein